MCRLAKIAAMIPITRLRPSSIAASYHIRVLFALVLWYSQATVDIVWQAEDSLREKKVESDLKDLLKTLVAFANSVAPGDTAKIFIGEKDDGTVQGVTNPESINRTVAKEADRIYPPIYYQTEVYEREGRRCVLVTIKHNGQAPHFGGPAWVRQGSRTVVAIRRDLPANGRSAAE